MLPSCPLKKEPACATNPPKNGNSTAKRKDVRFHAARFWAAPGSFAECLKIKGSKWLAAWKQNSKQTRCHASTTASSCHANSCTSPWAITAITNSVETAFGPTANDWTSHHVGPLFFAAAGQDQDATRMQNLSYTKALRKQKWLGDVQIWKSSRVHKPVSERWKQSQNGKNATVMMRTLSISRANPWEDLTHHHWLVGAGYNGLDSRKYLLILIKAGHRRKTNGYQDLHSDQSETDYRFEVLSKGNCGQSSCAAKHRPTDQNRVLEKTARCCR